MTQYNSFESTDPFTPEARRIVVVSGGLGDPSQTRMLADRLAEATSAELSRIGLVCEVQTVDLRLLANAISDALITNNNTPELQEAIDAVTEADGVIAVTPTFKASYSGLFKSFWDLVDEAEFVGTPVLLGATGGTPRHSLVIDQAMRPLFAYLKALLVPISVFAASDDWGQVADGNESTRTTPLSRRVAKAGSDFAQILQSRPARPKSRQEESEELEVTPFEQLLRG